MQVFRKDGSHCRVSVVLAKVAIVTTSRPQCANVKINEALKIRSAFWESVLLHYAVVLLQVGDLTSSGRENARRMTNE